MYTYNSFLFLLLLVLSRENLVAAQQGICFGTLFPKNSCLASDTNSFTISDFTTFTPADDNPVPSSVSFGYSDDTDPKIVHCSYSRNETDDNNFSKLTDDLEVSFTYTGNRLRITKGYISCSSRNITRVIGSLYINTFCYPNQPSSPPGNGTKCISPTGQISEEFGEYIS